MARIVVAMSGGVDSSVAAALLKEEGHEVIGMMLRLWSETGDIEDDGIVRVAQNKCCSLESVDDARRVARKLDIPFYLVNVEQEFKENVVDYFYQEYVAGRTPNPCLTCNRHIRFTLLLNRALALDAEFLATGHYVRVDTDPLTGKRRLRRGLDREKDQSYVLHVLNQKQLTHACFPLGPYTKPQVRAMAAERGMTVAAKPESQEICFVPRGETARYLSERLPVRSGVVVDSAGRELGTHRGTALYTVGQRSGFGDLSEAGPWYVVRIEAPSNRLVVGRKEELAIRELELDQVTFIDGRADEPLACQARLRYHAPPVAAVYQSGRLSLGEPFLGAAPGQAAVLYSGSRVLGGGIISTAA